MRTIAILLALCALGVPGASAQFGGGGSYGQCSGDLTGSYPGCTLATVRRPSSVIGSLPTCNAGSKGTMFLVTDALLPAALATVAAGGAVAVGVTCNGANWIVQ